LLNYPHVTPECPRKKALAALFPAAAEFLNREKQEYCRAPLPAQLHKYRKGYLPREMFVGQLS
jgi:hypothetical protein